MRSTKISICLLTYNHAHLLEEVLESILSQTYGDFELIVSDDCSNDGTWNLLQEIALQDPRVRLVRTPHNLGMAGNTNFAASFANGYYIALLHHDDILIPKALELWMAVANMSERVGFVFNDYLIGGEPIHRKQRRRFASVMEGESFLRRQLLSEWGCPIRGTALIRRRCFEEIGGMDLRFGLLADVDLWMRLAARWDVGYVNYPIMVIQHGPPENYPKAYTTFTWPRQNMLFSIHAQNVRLQYPAKTLGGRIRWLHFRARVTAETCKWLLYAALRKKREMVRSAADGRTDYEYPPTKLLRRILMRHYR